MAFCWVVIVLSMDSHDLDNYRTHYEYGLLSQKDWLFDLLEGIAMKYEVPFYILKILHSTVIWILVYRVFRIYTTETALAAAFFVLGPMIGMGTQMRSSMAGAIMLNALPLLLNKDSKWWKYCVLLVLASGFHLMALFYFVFLLPKFFRINSSKFRNYLIILTLLLIPFLLIFAKPIAQLILYIQKFVPVSTLSRIARYFSGEMSPNIKGFLFASGGHFVTFFLTDRLCETMLAARRDNLCRSENEKLDAYSIRYLHMLNSILLLFIPCYILSMQFDRFVSYFLPVCYCLIAQGVKELNVSPTPAQVFISHNKKLNTLSNNCIAKVGNILKLQNAQTAAFLSLLLLLSCFAFCFYVSNWHSNYAEFSRFVNGIGMFIKK